MLDGIGDVGSLKRRRYVGSSRLDQELWSNGGLSFGIKGFVYGSCDFAWFAEEEWIDPYNGKKYSKKPYLVVEGTDCLNTRSWGSAQIQRFHHALGPFLCGLNSLYFLNKGRLSIRPYLTGAAYYATLYHQQLGNKASYLVTDSLDDIRDLVKITATSGTDSIDFQKKVKGILQKMIDYFSATFRGRPYNGNWRKYLSSRAITRALSGVWVKDLGPRKFSLTDSSLRYGHILVGEVLTTKYLLIGSEMFNPQSEVFFYLFPLMTRNEIMELDRILANDKEWKLIRKADPSWRVIALDDLEGVDRRIIDLIDRRFRRENLNRCRREWNRTKEEIRNGLKTGTITIRRDNFQAPRSLFDYLQR